MVKVKLEHLTKCFGKVVAVNDLNLEIKDGELMVMLGPSGCGKTTTMLMIAGIYKPTKATYTLTMCALTTYLQRIGMLGWSSRAMPSTPI